MVCEVDKQVRDMSFRSSDPRSLKQISILSNFTVFVHVHTCECALRTFLVHFVCVTLNQSSWAEPHDELHRVWELPEIYSHYSLPVFSQSQIEFGTLKSLEKPGTHVPVNQWEGKIHICFLRPCILRLNRGVGTHQVQEGREGGSREMYKLSHTQNCKFRICVYVCEERVILDCLELYL